MNSFDTLAHEIFKQKQRMDQLEAENRELRTLLAKLRAGQGVLVDIAGNRFALHVPSAPPQSSLK